MSRSDEDLNNLDSINIIEPCEEHAIEYCQKKSSFPVDHGWAWLVVFGSFCTQAISGGINFSFGMLLQEFVQYFQTSYASTSLLTSLVPGIALGLGPLTGALTNLFGCRVVAIFGVILAVAGILLSLVAPNIYFMYFSYGIIAGYGFGACYIASMVVVPFYFDKKRSLATGLAACGIGFGTFNFGPLAEFLLKYYGNWKSVLLIEAGIVLNCIVFASLFRPPPNAKKSRARDADSDKGECPKSKFSQSVSSLPQLQTYYDRFEKKSLSDQKCMTDFKSDNHLHLRQKEVITPIRKFHSQNLHGGSCSAINTNSSSTDDNQTESTPKSKPSSKKIIWRDILDVTILKKPVFVIFGISNLLTSISFFTPYVFLPDRAAIHGIPLGQASFLISILGISNMLSRIFFGIVGDLKCTHRLILYSTCTAMAGFTSIGIVLCQNYPLLCLYATLQGCFMGPYGSMLPVVLIDLLGLDKLASSFGILMVFQGIGSILGPPLAGWLYDVTKDYDLVFYVIGALGALSGLMLFPVLLFQCKRPKDHSEAPVNS